MLFLLLLCLTCRFPFFFRDIHDWDESTFLLVGQSLLDGHLPFTKLWDLKPALLGYVYALIVFFSGKSIFLVRLWGSFFVFLTSVFIYFIGKDIYKKAQAGLLAATLFVVYSSLFPGGQGFLSEHAALPFMTLGLFLFLKENFSPFWSGLLFAFASMIRLNLAFVGGGLFFFLIYRFFKNRKGKDLKIIGKYCFGGLVGLVLVAFPYLINGLDNLWFTSTFLAPLSYSNSQLNLIQVALNQLENIWWATFPKGDFGLMTLGIFLWLGSCAFFFMKRNFHSNILVYVFFLVCLSILKGGAAFSHYLLQIFPFVCLFSAFFWTTFFASKKHHLKTLLLIPLLFSIFSLTQHYYQNIRETLDPPRWTFGFSVRLIDSLASQNQPEDTYFLMCDHLAYWWLDKDPIRPSVTHPSNISRAYLFGFMPFAEKTTYQELNSLLNQKPTWIIKKSEENYFRQNLKSKFLINKKLDSCYYLFKEMEGREIWRLNR